MYLGGSVPKLSTLYIHIDKYDFIKHHGCIADNIESNCFTGAEINDSNSRSKQSNFKVVHIHVGLFVVLNKQLTIVC